MGILDAHAFASDEARDWLQRISPAEADESLARALRSATAAGDAWLDASRAQEMLAAAELVAALNGHPHPELPPAAREWIADAAAASRTDAAPHEDLLALATAALDLVVTSSALSELWSQQPDESCWRSAMDDLRLRLSR